MPPAIATMMLGMLLISSISPPRSTNMAWYTRNISGLIFRARVSTMVMLAQMSMAPMLFRNIDRNAVNKSRIAANILWLLDTRRIRTASHLNIPDFSAPFTRSMMPKMTPRISMSMNPSISDGSTAPTSTIPRAAIRAAYILCTRSVAIRAIATKKITVETIWTGLILQAARLHHFSLSLSSR